MLSNKLVIGVLALSGASAIALSDAETDFKLRKMNRKIGNLKYVRPHEEEHFDIDDILGDFYG